MRSSGVWLPWVGRQVTRISVDFAFTLHLWRQEDGGAEIQIEAPFTVRSSTGERRYAPSGPRERLGPALSLFGRTVERAACFDDGALEIAFTDGVTLAQAGSDTGYEPWTVTGPGDLRIVSTGNRSLTTWGASALPRF
jgi:hypothetical protein